MNNDSIKLYHEKVIKTFNERGWSLYKTNSEFLTEEDIKICVEWGPELSFLSPGFAYAVLPMVDTPSNWEAVEKAMMVCLSNRRLPWYVDIVSDQIDENGNETLKAKGVYIIDSIVYYDNQTIELIFDCDLMFLLGITQPRIGNIVLPLSEAPRKILTQTTMQLKKKEMNNGSSERDRENQSFNKKA